AAALFLVAILVAVGAAKDVSVAHAAAFPLAVAGLGAAGAAWWAGRRSRTKRRPGWRRALTAVPVVLFVALPALAETFVLATDGPTQALPAGLAGAFVQTGNINTHYEQWGTTGSPVILLHGVLESTYVWSKAAPLLATDHRVFAYDTRGYGFTERRGPYTLDGDVAQLGDLIDALRLDAKPVLIGHSSGAAIITAFARLHPDRVAGIVLVDGDATPYGAGPGWAHDVIGEPLFTAAFRAALGSDALIRSVLRRQCGPTCTIELDKWRAPFRQPGAEDALLRILRRPLIGLEPAQLADVRVPAAVMSGELDSSMGQADVAATARLLHTDRTAVLKGEHHLPMFNSPATFVAQLTPLLDGLTGGPATS
ncbi:MAG: hypothetical protein QOG52_2377, partial [Frankiaceae bacterium]|nr:hypothetical protein [Frankiaceae bacterium]